MANGFPEGQCYRTAEKISASNNCTPHLALKLGSPGGSPSQTQKTLNEFGAQKFCHQPLNWSQTLLVADFLQTFAVCSEVDSGQSAVERGNHL